MYLELYTLFIFKIITYNKLQRYINYYINQNKNIQ